MRIFLFVLLFINFLFAHKLNIFLDQEDNKVYSSSYFASGSFCKNCEIEVRDENQNLLETGKTDNNGEFIITNLAPKIIVEVKTKNGHGAKSSLEIKEVIQKNIQEKSGEIKLLKEEIAKLKSENKMLKEKIEQNEIFKMIFALLVIAGVFFFLKKIKRNNE